MEKNLKEELFKEIVRKGIIVEQKQESSELKELLSKLFHSQTQAHIFHLQVKSQSSHAEHLALGEYYEGIDGLLDKLIESYQGKYDIIKGYKSYNFEDYKNGEELINYFKNLIVLITKNRKSIKESYLQNQIDGIEELIYSTLYKLRNLK